MRDIAATFAEYQSLRLKLEYTAPDSPGLTYEIWAGCSSENQEEMLAHFRTVLALRDSRKERYVQTHGEVW